MHNATYPRYETNEYPVISVVRNRAANGSLPHPPVIETATFITVRGPHDDLALARLSGQFLDPGEVLCSAVSPGFTVVLRAERTVYRKKVIVGVEIHRDDPNAGAQCVVRFSCGSSYVHATVDVRCSH